MAGSPAGLGIRETGRLHMEIKRISPEEAKQHLDNGDGHVCLDVRTQAEFNAGHSTDAKNVPVWSVIHSAGWRRILTLSKSSRRTSAEARSASWAATKVDDHSGRPAAFDAGFTDVVDMPGGFGGETDQLGQVTYPGWSLRGLPVTTESPEEDRYETLARYVGQGR
jgi:rhodanese-related sulfurtransferase